MGFHMTNVCCVSRKERKDAALFRFEHCMYRKDVMQNDRALFPSPFASIYLFPAMAWGRLNSPFVSRNSKIRLPRNKRKFRWRARPFFFCLFFFAKTSFPVIRASVNVGCRFLQIVAPRYRIGNFRNLSCPSNDLSPAHRPFDTANALDRSMHSTSLRSIDTSDTLHRDV